MGRRMASVRDLGERASSTAEFNAGMRWAETTRPEHGRVVTDPYSFHFLTSLRGRALFRLPALARLTLRVIDHRYAGLTAEILLRGRYLDDAVRSATATGIRQIILLGAGYDSTALRHEFGSSTTVYEVDARATQRTKRTVLDRLDVVRSHRIVPVPCNFKEERVADLLREAGLRTDEPALVAWLGVSYYLPEASVRDTLDQIREVCAPGSIVVVDYLDADVVNGTTVHAGAKRLAKYVAAIGEPYVFGLTPARARELLVAHGFDVTDHARVTDLVARYADNNPWFRSDDYMGVLTARPAV